MLLLLLLVLLFLELFDGEDEAEGLEDEIDGVADAEGEDEGFGGGDVR